MEKQKGKHISSFGKGEIITRIEPAIYVNEKTFNSILGIFEVTSFNTSNSRIGIPVKYKRVANRIIYVECVEDKGGFKKEGILELEYEAYKDGWAKYIDPETLGEFEGKMLNKEDAQRFLEDIIANYSN